MYSAFSTILFILTSSSNFTLQETHFNRSHKKRPKHCCCDRDVKIRLPFFPVSELTEFSQTRPIPSPAFNQEPSRNEVHPLQNAQKPEMDESLV